MVLRQRNRRIYGFLTVLGGGLVALSLLPGEPQTATTAMTPGAGTAAGATDASPAPGPAKLLSVRDVSGKPAHPAPAPQVTLTASVDGQAALPRLPVASDAGHGTPAEQAPPKPRLVAEVADAGPQAAATDAGQAAIMAPGRIGAIPVNVRAGPSSSAPKLFVAKAGEPVQLGATDGGWIRVVTADGGTGWVYSRYIEAGPN